MPMFLCASLLPGGSPLNTTRIRDQLVDNLTADVQGADRCFLVDLHEPAVADHIGTHDCRKCTLDVLHRHGRVP